MKMESPPLGLANAKSRPRSARMQALPDRRTVEPESRSVVCSGATSMKSVIRSYIENMLARKPSSSDEVPSTNPLRRIRVESWNGRKRAPTSKLPTPVSSGPAKLKA